MKIFVLAAAAALLVTPAFAQGSGSAVQGSGSNTANPAQQGTGSQAGGYANENNTSTGRPTTGAPATTGSTGSGMMNNQSGTMMQPQGQGTTSGNAPRQ